MITEIQAYTNKLGLTCSMEDCLEIYNLAELDGVIDPKQAVWNFLDEFEGICHSRDADYWKGKP
jgi:hypothetical protein